MGDEVGWIAGPWSQAAGEAILAHWVPANQALCPLYPLSLCASGTICLPGWWGL